ncbi:DMT family transporter [Antarcticirhabdus aurantiaca]|uniref:DMT family transporter n=1 Tax=Antarcticirhabdus aurantiaca TaxID=2606717 RepID=A0ACD4NIN9_9HYPH|nr:DMT family transporter [Antarcticirhabdus aurantiaca]WAJ26673.1 DMT family transporter [Jeongeuplla avenae]
MDSSPAAISAAPNPTLGIGLKCLSVLVFVAMQTSIKIGGQGIPAGEIVFFRSFFALLPVFIYLAWLGQVRTALRTDDLGGHFIRGAVGVSSMGLGFFALTRLPYPEWISISYATPLLTVVFAALFLGEVVRAYRWTAVVVGLVGVLVVLAPNLSLLSAEDALAPAGDEQAVGALASMASAVFAAFAMIQVRRLVRKENTATIVVFFSLTCSAIALLTVWNWVLPTPWQAFWLVMAGLFGGVGQLLLTACYRYADTSTIAPFEYTSLLLAIAIGAILFNEAIYVTTLIGGAIVVGAGIFIIWRERRLGIERAKARRVSTPNG